MRRYWFLLLLALLPACAPMLTPFPQKRALAPASAAAGVLVFKDAGGALLLNSYLPLPAPAGSVITAQSYQGKTSESRFTNSQDFEEVLRLLRLALMDSGWRVVSIATQETPPSYHLSRLLVQKKEESKVVILKLEKGEYSVEVREP